MTIATHGTAPDIASGTPAGGSAAPFRRWLWGGALAALTAGALHVVAAFDHAHHGDVVVGFFLLTVLAQVGGGLFLALHAWTGLLPDRRLVLAGLVGTVGLIALFVVAYSTDLLGSYTAVQVGAHGDHAAHASGPFAAGLPTRNDTLTGVREAPGVVGLLTVGAELVTTLVLVALLPRTWRGRVTNVLSALAALAWVLWFTGVIG